MNWSAFLPLLAAVAVLLGLAMAAMAIGVIVKRPCLRGSCGGPEAIGPDGKPLTCAACPNRKHAPAASAPLQ